LEDVVAQQDVLADPYRIPGDAVVFGTRPCPAGHFQAGAAELRQALLVQVLDALLEIAALLQQAAANHFIGAALGDGLGYKVLLNVRGHAESRRKVVKSVAFPERRW